MDTSYSGITGKIQHDKTIGKEVITELALEYITNKEKIVQLESELKKLSGWNNSVRHGVDMALKHLEMKLPLAVKIDDGIIVNQILM